MTSQQPRSIFQSGYLLAAMALGAFLWTPFATAATMEEIALLKSAGRQKILVDGAKKEARLMFYTALIVDQVVRPMKAAFEKEYPFIQLEFFRANSDRLGQKILTEYQAKRYDVDVVSGSGATTVARQAGYLQKFLSPHSAEYPAELKDPQGFWGVSNVYFMTLGYNSRMVKPNDVPRTYEDLLNPRWKNQMMWSTNRTSGAPLFIGNALLTMGDNAGKSYLQKLKAQSIANNAAANRQILDLVIAGEYPLGLMIFNHHAHISKIAGAPAEWQALEPVPATISTVGLAKHAPHPHAAMLFLDFLLSRAETESFSSGELSTRASGGSRFAGRS